VATIYSVYMAIYIGINVVVFIWLVLVSELINIIRK